MLKISFGRLNQTLGPEIITALVEYLRISLETGGYSYMKFRTPEIQFNCTIDGAIPPAIMCAALRKASSRLVDAEENATGIFHNDIEKTAFDQLQLSAMHFDLLRSVWELPVIPTSTKLRAIGAPNWYSELRFERGLEVSSSSILAVKDKKVMWTGLEPEIGMYYRPVKAFQPCIDRFFVAEAEKEQCLVMYQDNINAEEFHKAVVDMNLAADILSERLSLPILYIANITGSSTETQRQRDFKYPCLISGWRTGSILHSYFCSCHEILTKSLYTIITNTQLI